MTISSNVKPIDWSNIDISNFDNIQYDKPSMIGSVTSEGFAAGLSSVSPDISLADNALENVESALSSANDAIMEYAIGYYNAGLSEAGEWTNLNRFMGSLQIQTLPDFLSDAFFEESTKAAKWNVSIDGSKIQQASDRETEKKPYYASSEPRTSRKVLNNVLEELISSGPDAMSNMFDVFFLIGTSYSTAKTLGLLEEMNDEIAYDTKEFAYPVLLSSRVLSIDIPSSCIDTYDDELPVGKLVKGSSSLGFDNKSSFSYRLDSDLLTYDMLSQLSLTSLQTLADSSIKEGVDVPFSFIRSATARKTSDKSDAGALHIIVKRSVTAPHHHQLSESKKNGIYGFDDVYTPLGPTWEDSRWDNTDMASVSANSRYLNDWFVFENVKLLGSDDGISLDRETPNSIEHNVEFIFRRLLRYNQQTSTFESLGGDANG